MNVRRLLFAALLLMMAAPSFSQDEIIFSAYVLDNPKDPTTNLRSAPKGKIVKKLPRGTYELYLSDVKNGWWKVDDLWDADGGEENEGQSLNPTQAYWIHYSVIAVGTRNYGGEKLMLREKPADDAKAVWSFKDEITLRPMDVQGEWVKVRTVDGTHTGWIEMDWLCGNPVTNCC